MWAVIAASITVAMQAATLEPMPKGDPAMDLTRQFAGALTNGDAQALRAVLAPNVTMFWIDETVRGRDGVLSYFRSQGRVFKGISVSLTNMEPATARTVSAMWGASSVAYIPIEGRTGARYTCRYTTVAKKIDNQWLLTSIHFSIAYPPFELEQIPSK